MTRSPVEVTQGRTATEEGSAHDPRNGPDHGPHSLILRSAPLGRTVRIAGAPQLDAWVRAPAGGHMAPVLVDVAPGRTIIATGPVPGMTPGGSVLRLPMTSHP